MFQMASIVKATLKAIETPIDPLPKSAHLLMSAHQVQATILTLLIK